MKLVPFSIGLGMMMLTIFGLLFLLSGCADLGKAGAKMYGLEVVSADDCRHFLAGPGCTTKAAKP